MNGAPPATATGRACRGSVSAGSGPEFGGVSDIAFIDDQSFYLITNLGDDLSTRAELAPEMADIGGWLWRGDLDGGLEKTADVAAFKTANNPDSADVGSALDSNPCSVTAVEGGRVVADAGGNDLVMVEDAGQISLPAVFPSPEFDFPAEMLAAMGGVPEGEGAPPEGEALPAGSTVLIPVQAVPTSVVVESYGAYYVSQLTGDSFPVAAHRYSV